MRVEKRDIIISIVLSFVTCGFYSIYWFYKLAEETNIITNNEQDMSPIMVLLLSFVTCGIYGFVWAYQTGEKLDNKKMQLGMPTTGAALYLLLYLIAGIGAYAIMQNDINNIIDRQNIPH